MIKDTLNFLVDKGVYSLQQDSYNEEDDMNYKYVDQYNSLYQELIVGKIFKHFGIDANLYKKGLFGDFYFDYFFYADDDISWFGKFMIGDEPVYFEIDSVLDRDFSDLNELKEIASRQTTINTIK